MSMLMVMAIILIAPSFQIGFELSEKGKLRCMEVYLEKGYTLNGTYLITGINENNINFYVHSSIRYKTSHLSSDMPILIDQIITSSRSNRQIGT